MRIGLQLPVFTWPGGPPEIRGRLSSIARTADDAGFASLWVMDHFFQIPIVGEAEQEMLEGYTTLSYLAGATRRMKLGTLVTGVTYRHPGILVKTATTLDVLSGGRAYLGIGAAWFDREHHGLGVPFPPLGERFQRLRGPPLPAGRDAQPPAAALAAPPAHPDRRPRREEDAAPGRAVRGRLQPVHLHRQRRAGPQAGRPAAPLRRAGPTLR